MISGLMAALNLMACNNSSDTKPAEASKSGASDSSGQRPNVSQAVTTHANSLNGILSAYLQIKNALANDDPEEAAKSGNAFVEALGKLDAAAMTAEQKKTFGEASDDAKEMAEHIGNSAGKIAHQREHFEMLSNDMYAMVKALKADQTLYMDHCPMYNDGKGADWISETKTIRNPYLGKKMPTCGEVKEEIK